MRVGVGRGRLRRAGQAMTGAGAAAWGELESGGAAEGEQAVRAMAAAERYERMTGSPLGWDAG